MPVPVKAPAKEVQVKQAGAKQAQARDPERTRGHILAAARKAFARYGLAGARVDAIAEAARANKRMIYYYFTDKEGLFLATLEQIYAELGAASEALDLEADPETALARYVDFIWTYYLDHPDAIAILNSENLHGGRHLRHSSRVRQIEVPFVDKLSGMLERGVEAGVFRPGLDAVALHITVVALAYFFLGNNITLSIFFDRDLSSPAARRAWRRHMQSTLKAMLAA